MSSLYEKDKKNNAKNIYIIISRFPLIVRFVQ